MFMECDREIRVGFSAAIARRNHKQPVPMWRVGICCCEVRARFVACFTPADVKDAGRANDRLARSFQLPDPTRYAHLLAPSNRARRASRSDVSWMRAIIERICTSFEPSDVS